MNTDTSIYTDFNQFASLRSEAQSNPDAALDQVATQFESLFVQMMMKSMRDASTPLESGLMQSNQMESYQKMFDQQLSLDLSNGGGLGLADLIAAQIGGAASTVVAKDSQGPEGIAAQDNSKQIGDYLGSLLGQIRSGSARTASTPDEMADVIDETADLESNTIETPFVSTNQVPAGPSLVETPVEPEVTSWLPESPGEFIRDLWGFAEKAAATLGVSPKVILAQAALETGWGKHVIRDAEGASSFNLFGIKAGSSWSGEQAQVKTLEYENGVASKQTAAFRSYDSLADAFEDYVSFLTQSPRYQQALEGAQDAVKYVRGLQDGGYATDPNYAEKILSILKRDEFSAEEARQSLKKSSELPL